jgi:hypothetical protein
LLDILSAIDRQQKPALLLPQAVLADPCDRRWPGFVAGWDDLPRDTWMADGGTYRRRRYGAFRVEGGRCERLPHRPHYQELDHNPLNGGLERWFAPMLDASAESPLFRDLLLVTAALLEDSKAAWLVEAHQFRIEASAGRPGLPTPEGMHRDGRDRVLILLVNGRNFTGGTTRVEDAAGAPLLEHRLSYPGEALLLDDRAVRHGTSPIEAIDSRLPAWRDTLVLTFAALSTP